MNTPSRNVLDMIFTYEAGEEMRVTNLSWLFCSSSNVPSIKIFPSCINAKRSETARGDMNVVRDDNRCHFVFLLQLHNQFADFSGSDWIQSRGGLIEKQDVGRQGQSTGQADPLLHSPGNLSRHFVQILLHADAR